MAAINAQADHMHRLFCTAPIRNDAMRAVLLNLLPALCALAPLAHAQDCAGPIAALAERAYAQRPGTALPDRAGWVREPLEGACRAWPARPELTLLAVPVWRQGAEPDLRDGDLEVMVLDTASARPQAWLRVPHALDSDAIRATGLQLDTAAYQLDAATRAFGVRVDRSGSSMPNPFGETSLRLFVYQPGALRAVSAPLVVERMNGEWDTRCAGDFVQIERSVAIGPARAGGYADLVVRQRGTQRSSRDVDGQCEETTTPTATVRYVLRHDGRRYPVPAALAPL